VTFGLPLFMTLIFAASILLQKKSFDAEQAGIEQSRLAYVDQSGLPKLDPPERAVWKLYPDEAAARRQMAADKVGTLIVLPPDYVATGKIGVLTTRRPTLTTFQDNFVPRAFEEWLVRRLLSGETPERVTRARRPVGAPDVQFLLPDASGPQDTERPEAYITRIITAAFFFVLLFLSISVSGGYLIQGMADEKENRVLEMVISSVTPGELMAGKLIGLGAAGLLQVGIWSGLGITTVLLFVVSFALHPGLFAFCAVFYLLGYLLYGSLLLGIGSLGSNQRESMQYTWILSLTTASPLVFWFNILSDPQSTLAHIFTAIPLTAPITMMVRYSVDPAGTPGWQILATLAWLVISTLLALKISAKVYRVGLLLYGKRPTPREIWRWIRA